MRPDVLHTRERPANSPHSSRIRSGTLECLLFCSLRVSLFILESEYGEDVKEQQQQQHLLIVRNGTKNHGSMEPLRGTFD